MIYQGDCLEIMPNLPDKSVDMILCDLPYGVTSSCDWDAVIPFEHMWKQYKRLVQPYGAIVLTACQPFTSALVMSNVKDFRYEWVWNKTKGANFYQANFAPMKAHENILVFSKSPCVWNQSGWMKYYPIKSEGAAYLSRAGSFGKIMSVRKNYKMKQITTQKEGRYPLSILTFKKDSNKIHPTQKPVALFEYLIKTYTNPGDTVLDNCMGSGTTGAACYNTGRKFIGIEKDEGYFKIAENRKPLFVVQ